MAGGPAASVRRMKGYGKLCPVAKASEVFVQRWTPLILRELLCGARRFGDLLQGLPLMSRALLAARLKELEAYGLIAATPDPKGGSDYRLTPAGAALKAVIEELSAWGQTWGQGSIGPADLNVVQLAWAMRQHSDPVDRPERRLVARLEFSGVPRRDIRNRIVWLVIEPRGFDVCLRYPGYEEQLVVRADLGAFTRTWLGYMGLAEARQAGKIAFEGKARDMAALRRAVGLADRPQKKSFRFQSPEAALPADATGEGRQTEAARA